MLHLTADQKVELDILLIRLVGKAIITPDQKDQIMATLLDLPELTDDSEQRERQWIDSIAPTAEALADIHQRAAERNAENALQNRH